MPIQDNISYWEIFEKITKILKEKGVSDEQMIAVSSKIQKYYYTKLLVEAKSLLSENEWQGFEKAVTGTLSSEKVITEDEYEKKMEEFVKQYPEAEDKIYAASQKALLRINQITSEILQTVLSR